MTIPEAELQRLLLLGQSVLRSSESSESLLTELTTFIDGIDALPLSEVSSENEATLRTLAVLHAEVLAYADSKKTDLSKGLSDLRKRGKGILAYADHLPKQLSARQGKKG